MGQMLRRRRQQDQSDVWSFYQSLGSDDRGRLSPTELEVAAICDLRQEVNSGGFDSYFRYWGGNTAPQAADALPKVLGEEWAAVLTEAMSLLGPAYPRDPDLRFELLDEPHVIEALHGLDTRYFELEASIDADALMTAHLAASKTR